VFDRSSDQQIIRRIFNEVCVESFIGLMHLEASYKPIFPLSAW